MESRRDSWQSVKKRVLEGHKAMASLGEDNEDTPYPAPRPITGLPEPISREGLPSFEVKSKMDEKCAKNTLNLGTRMDNISGSPKPIPSEVFQEVFYSESGSGVESEIDEKDIQTTLEPSMKGVRRDIRNYIHKLHSTIVDLHLKNQHLYRDNKRIHSKYDDCLKRNGILQGRVETSGKEVEFLRKILESSKYKGENGFMRVQDLKNEKRVKFCNGKKEHDDSPLLDPAVKAQVDKRLEPISRLRSDDRHNKEENCNINNTISDKDTVFYTMDVHKRYLKECMAAKLDRPSIRLNEEVGKDVEHNINRKYNERKAKDVVNTGKDNESKTQDMIDNGKDNECKILDMVDNSIDNEHEKLNMVKKNKSNWRAYNMEAIYLYNMIDNDTYSYNIADGYLTCHILKPGYVKHKQNAAESHPPKVLRPVPSAGSPVMTKYLVRIRRVIQSTYEVVTSDSDVSSGSDVSPGSDLSSSSNDGICLDVDALDIGDVKRILYEIEKLEHLMKDSTEDAPALEGKNTTNNIPPIKKNLKYNLGKYRTLPPIGRNSNNPSSFQNPDNKKTKQRPSSHDDPSKINSHVSSKVTIKSTGSHTAHTPTPFYKENKNKSRLVKLLHLPNIKSSSENNNQTLPKIKSIKLNDAAKGEPITENTRSNCPNIKSSFENNNQTLPKIKSTKPKYAAKGCIRLTEKIKLPILPSLMKATQALPRIYEPHPPTTKQSKRPYTAKYKLPFK